MKNGVSVGLPSGWKFLTSHSSLLTNKKNGAVFSGGGRKLLQGTEKGINFASQFRNKGTTKPIQDNRMNECPP